MAILVDTCVWIDVESGGLGAVDIAAMTRNQAAYTSPVVLAELRYGLDTAGSDAARLRRRAVLARIERKPVLPIDKTTAQIYAMLAAHVHARGANPRRRVQDLWIASQAIQHALTLLTRNRKNFDGLPGLDLLGYELPA